MSLDDGAGREFEGGDEILVSSRLRGDPPARALARRAVWSRISDAVTVYGLPGIDGLAPMFVINLEGVPAAEEVDRLLAALESMRAVEEPLPS